MRKKMGVIAMALAMVVALQGCYGSFGLTRNLYKWNGHVGDKIVNEVVFLVCSILPVYGITVFVDAIVLNSVEFWTGKNPMTSKIVTDGDKKLVMNFDKATGLVNVSVYEGAKLTGQMALQRTDSGIVALDVNDHSKVLARGGVDAEGKAFLANGQGLVLAQNVL